MDNKIKRQFPCMLGHDCVIQTVTDVKIITAYNPYQRVLPPRVHVEIIDEFLLKLIRS